MAQVYVGIGSNTDRESSIRKAINALQQKFGKLAISTVYESEPVGLEGGNFYNLVIGFQTALPVRKLAQCLHKIEVRCGHGRPEESNSTKNPDIDLLLYGDAVINEEGLSLPRLDVTQYGFILRPLAELAGDMEHPQLGLTFAELSKIFDKSGQKFWPIPFLKPGFGV